MKKMPLILSLMVNVLLVAAVFSARLHYHKIIFQTLYNVTTAGVRFNESILAELRSDDTYKIESVKIMIEKNIREGKVAAEVWKSAAERIRMR